MNTSTVVILKRFSNGNETLVRGYLDMSKGMYDCAIQMAIAHRYNSYMAGRPPEDRALQNVKATVGKYAQHFRRLDPDFVTPQGSGLVSYALVTLPLVI